MHLPHQPNESSAASLREHLSVLDLELALARANGLSENATYMADLESDAALTRAAYVGASVTEIASLRAALNGPLQG